MSTNSDSTMPRGCSILFALPFVLVGSYIMGTSLGFLPSSSISRIPEMPPMIMATAGAILVFGGLFVLLQSSFSPSGQQTALYKWLEFFIASGLLLAFGIIFLWIGLDPTGRIFSSSSGAEPAAVSEKGNYLAGRLAFGTFGLITLIGAIRLIYQKIISLPFGGDEPTE